MSNNILSYAKSFSEKASIIAISLAFILFPLISIVSGGGISVLLWLSAYPIFLMLFLHRNWEWTTYHPYRWLAAFLILAAISYFWSVDQTVSEYVSRIMLNVAIPGFLFILGVSMLCERNHWQLGKFIIAATVVTIILLYWEWYSYGDLTTLYRIHVKHELDFIHKGDYLNKMAMFIAPFSWGVMAIAFPRMRFIWICIGWTALGYVLLQFNSLAAVVSYGAATIIWLTYYLTNGRIYSLLVAAVVGVLFLTPLIMFMINDMIKELALPYLPLSAYYRLFVWEFFMDYFTPAQPFGEGIGATRTMQKVYLPAVGNEKAFTMDPNHPHNTVLQVWIELGLIGIILYGGLILSLMKTIHQSTLNVPYRAFALACLLCFFCEGLFENDIWRDRWLALPFILAALMRVAYQPYRNQSQRINAKL